MKNEGMSTTNPFNLLGIAGATIISGAILGALTNAINGAVSPMYFINVLGWQDVQNVWRASIAQGIFEGLIYGGFFSIIFTAFIGWVSGGKITFNFVFRHLLIIVIAVFIFWMIGGTLGMLLAWLSPEFYSHAFIGVPQKFSDMLRYAWVGGSIFSVLPGSLISLVIGCILFRTKWHKIQE